MCSVTIPYRPSGIEYRALIVPVVRVRLVCAVNGCSKLMFSSCTIVGEFFDVNCQCKHRVVPPHLNFHLSNVAVHCLVACDLLFA